VAAFLSGLRAMLSCVPRSDLPRQIQGTTGGVAVRRLNDYCVVPIRMAGLHLTEEGSVRSDELGRRAELHRKRTGCGRKACRYAVCRRCGAAAFD